MELASFSIYPLERQTKGSAGYDLAASEQTVVPARGQIAVSTGLRLKFLRKNMFGLIKPRSGLAFKHSLDVGAGVIDPDYTNIIKVIMFNHSDKDFVIEKGMRIAQIVFIPTIFPSIYEVPDERIFDEMFGDVTHAGFGSTGV